MTFQAYLDTIKQKTGLGPDDFRRLAAEKGYLEPGTKAKAILDWVKADYDLGPGHGMAIVSILGLHQGAGMTSDDKLEAQFAGAKEKWRPVFDSLLDGVDGEVGLAPTNTYISLLKGASKFGIVAVSGDRMDVGIKLRGEPAAGRFEASGTWNSMVTHRVRLMDAGQADAELLSWLQRAYDAAK
ncbi:MAG: DUF4287 domain-containing protein [Actinomycetota bacterium]